MKIAQQQLGHASVSTTLSIYTHVVDASHRQAIEAVEARLFGDLAALSAGVGSGYLRVLETVGFRLCGGRDRQHD